MPVAAIKKFFQKPIFGNQRFIVSIFLLAALVTAIQNTFFLNVNNYKIFFYSLQNLRQGVDLYAEHPSQHYDYFLYAPAFPVFFSPFFLLPYKVGLFLWHFFFAVVWLVAVYNMPLRNNQKVFVLWYCFQEMVLALGNAQTNPLIAAVPLFAFIAFEKNKPFWAAFFILLGFNIKIYSIVAAALFIVYPQKVKFILSGFFWALVFALLPLLFTTPDKLLWQYQSWLGRLFQKSDHDRVTNISIHRLIYQTVSPDIPTLAIVGVGVVLFCTVYIHRKVFKNENFRMLLLSSILVFQVIFHPAAESATYITAVTGVTIYWLYSPRNTLDLILIVACYVLTVMGSTDLMPPYLKNNFIKPYVLKALPCVLIWFRVLYLMHNENMLSKVRFKTVKGV
jgi:hypothetical protein